MRDQLQPCPFCGNDSFNEYDLQGVHIVAQQRTQGLYGVKEQPHTSYYVQCFRCYARSGNAIAGLPNIAGATLDDDTARQAAIDNWNMRTLQATATSSAATAAG